MTDLFCNGLSSHSMLQKQHLTSSVSLRLSIRTLFLNVVTAIAIPSAGGGALQDIWSQVKLWR